MDSIPHIPEDLVEYLEATYPDQVPTPDDLDRMIWMKVGQVELVRMLRMHMERQQESLLTSEG